jgi:formylglycine-generating enzyme required for sulfatase activity
MRNERDVSGCRSVPPHRGGLRRASLFLLLAGVGLPAVAAAQGPLTDTDFVLIRPGTFQMGGTGDADEQPIHAVSLTRAFYLEKTEVTQAQWFAIMGHNPSHHEDCSGCPVDFVSWDDVQSFIRALNARSGRTYRLPTEAEWEYAARAGTTGDYGTPGAVAQGGWTSENSGGATHVGGRLQSNAWGLFDMEGNVWEWVNDWYGPYPSGHVTDPKGPASGPGRVLRGGSWDFTAAHARSSTRNGDTASFRSDSFGFRLARTAPSAPGTRTGGS